MAGIKEREQENKNKNIIFSLVTDGLTSQIGEYLAYYVLF